MTTEFQFPKATPQLRDLLDRVGVQISQNLNCHIIAQVEKFDKLTNTIEASCSFKRQYSDGTIMEFPKFIDVPVITLSGGGGFLSFPIKQGDWCLLLFCDRDIDSWWYSGKVVEPNSPRHHALSDAVALVGLRPAPEVFQLTDDAVTLNAAQNPLELKNNYAKIGISNSGKAHISNAVASLFTILDTFMTALSTLAVDPSSHIIMPSTVAAITAVKAQLALLMEA